MVETSCYFVVTYFVYIPQQPHKTYHHSGFVITMQTLIITTAVRPRSCYGCIGALVRFSLNRCVNHQILYPTYLSYPCT